MEHGGSIAIHCWSLPDHHCIPTVATKAGKAVAQRGESEEGMKEWGGEDVGRWIWNLWCMLDPMPFSESSPSLSLLALASETAGAGPRILI